MGTSPLTLDIAHLPYRFACRPTKGASVDRHGLLRRITEASLLKQFVLIRGPAGAGKTTLLAQWQKVADEVRRPTAWLTLDRGDANIASLISGLADALQNANLPKMAQVFRDVLPTVEREPIFGIGRRLAASANATGEQPVILLDQLDAIDSPEMGELFDGLLQHVTSLRFVAASRTRSHISFGGLRTRDQYFEIGPDDLNLTLSEIHEAMGEAVPELYARRLHQETSGEAVAVGFACRVLEGSGMFGLAPRSWRDELDDYYRSEVLGRLPPSYHGLMSRLVMVEQFDVSLARAIAGPDVHELIERLHYMDGLLLREPRSNEYYFPGMLQKFLERRFSLLDDDERTEVHLRAAHWFNSRGRHSEALRHAMEARSQELAIKLIERIGYNDLMMGRGIPAAHSIFDAITSENKLISPDVLLSMAIVHAHEGSFENAIACLQEAKALMKDQARSAESNHKLIMVEAMVAGFLDQPPDVATDEVLATYLASAPPNEHQGKAFANLLLSWSHFVRGDIDAAIKFTDIARPEYDDIEGVYGAIFLHAHRAIYRFWQNEIEGALGEAVLAEKMALIFFPDDPRLISLVRTLRATLQLEIGQPDPLLDVTELVGVVGSLEGWVDIQLWAHRLGITYALANHRPDEAQAILGFGLEVAQRRNSQRLAWNIRLWGVYLALRADDEQAAWAQAEALDLFSENFLTDSETYFTWQERNSGLTALVRLYTLRHDLANVERLLDLLEDEVGRAAVLRFKAGLQIERARLADRRGDSEAARGFIEAARLDCPEILPVGLFLDNGEFMLAYVEDLSPWPQPRFAPGNPAPLASEAATTGDPLTERERQILNFMSKGHPNKVAAYQLGLSEATVKFHLRNIYKKLQAHNRIQALERYRLLIGDRSS